MAGACSSKRKRKGKTLKDGSPAEATIQRAILDWLEETGLLHWRSNSGVAWAHGRKLFLGPDGMPDITVLVHPGARYVGLEVKSANGKVSKDQVAFAKKLTDAGGLYFVVRSLADAKNSIAAALGERTGATDDGS